MRLHSVIIEEGTKDWKKVDTKVKKTGCDPNIWLLPRNGIKKKKKKSKEDEADLTSEAQCFIDDAVVFH